MTEYISREAALEAIQKHKEEMAKTGGVSNRGKAFYLLGQDHAVDVLRIVPAADVKPVVKGEWKGDKYFETCSVCGSEPAYFVGGWEWEVEKMPNFCPNCGADMRKEAKDE